MQNHDSGRKPNSDLYASARAAAKKKWERLLNDKMRAVQLAMDSSGSAITPHKLLILVDLQSIYLAFHKWLSDHKVPIDDGLIIGRLGHFQIERISKEVANRLAISQPSATADLSDLLDSIKIEYIDDRPHLGSTLNVLKNGTYLDISANFEMFYAPVPLREIEGKLWVSARRGSAEAKNQLTKVRAGIVTRKGAFERDYKAYDDFIAHLKESTLHSCSQEGFFGYSVGEHGLRYFDEKEVDIRIAIRAMDALHKREADSICIISPDQDFLPLHARAKDFGVPCFQADPAKLATTDKTGSRFKTIGARFIRAGIDPSWPLKILIEAMSAPDYGVFATHALSEVEIQALCRLHNDLNDVKTELSVNPDGKVTGWLFRRPLAP